MCNPLKKPTIDLSLSCKKCHVLHGSLIEHLRSTTNVDMSFWSRYIIKISREIIISGADHDTYPHRRGVWRIKMCHHSLENVARFFAAVLCIAARHRALSSRAVALHENPASNNATHTSVVSRPFSGCPTCNKCWRPAVYDIQPLCERRISRQFLADKPRPSSCSNTCDWNSARLDWKPVLLLFP